MMSRNLVGLLASVAALSFTVLNASAQEDWKKTWDDTVAKAKGQTLVLSVHAADGYAPVVRDFQKAYPDIKVDLTELIPDAMMTRVVGEQKNGIYAWDSMWASTSNMNGIMIGAGLFQDLEPFLILPEVKEDKYWRNPEYRWTTDRAHQVHINSLSKQILNFVNTDNLPKGVKVETLDDLLNPKLKGLIGIRDPYHVNGGTWTFGSYYKAKGPDFMKKFYNMDLVVNMNPRQNADAVMRGDLAIGTGITSDVIARCRHAGGCESVKELPFGAVVGPRGVAVFKNAPHPEAAKVWVNWLLSKAGQQAYVTEWTKYNDTGAISLRTDVEAANPEQAKSEPDYAKLDDAFIPGTDKGDAVQKAAMDLYVQVKGGPR